MDAVITAGGRIEGEFAERVGVKVKALIEIGGRPIISRVVEAISGMPEVDRVFVIGPEEIRDSGVLDDPAVELLPEAPEGAVNFMTGLSRCSTHHGCRALFAASDLPFLSTRSVRDFIDRCDPESDFCYPVVTSESFLETYPGAPVKFESLRGGRFTGGCVFLVNPLSLLSNRETIEQVFNLRKSPLRLAALLGWRFSVGLLTRTVSIESCARRASQIIGCKCQATLESPAELAYDMDDLADYEYAVGLKD